jgi:hypothetical protein
MMAQELKEILDPQTTSLWFTVKEMQRDKTLQVNYVLCMAMGTAAVRYILKVSLEDTCFG